MRKVLAVFLSVIFTFLMTVSSSAVTLPLRSTLAAPSYLATPFMSQVGARSVSIVWQDNSSSETGFKIERRSTSSFSWTEIGKTAANITAYDDKGLNPASTYVYRVRAYNALDNSTYSNELTITTDSELTVTFPKGGETLNGGSTYDIKWSIVGDHSGFMGYDAGVSIYYSTDGTNYNIVNRTSVGAGEGSFSWVVPNVSTTAAKVMVSYDHGYLGIPSHVIGMSASSFTMKKTIKLSPINPSNLSAQVASTSQIYLEWDQCADDKVGFKIERKTSTEAFKEIATVDKNTYTYIDKNLKAGTDYSYRVKAYNNLGSSGYSNTANAMTQGLRQISTTFLVLPSAPTELAGSAISATDVMLTWKDANASETGFRIERKKEGGSYVQIAEIGYDMTTWTDKGLPLDSVYYYRVRAYNSAGNSAYSSEVQVKTFAISKLPGKIIPIIPLPDPTPPPAATPEPVQPSPTPLPGGEIDYSSASGWAVLEIEKARQYGLTTPQILSDFRNEITREEFCEVSVKLYEALSGKIAQPISPNPFSDTTNPEILKAYNLGISNGVPGGKFAPSNHITRQEIAAMLMRALKASYPADTFSSSGTLAYTDTNKISGWALDSVVFMNKNKIMNGIPNNLIDPLGNTTREQAIAMLKRLFETFRKV